MKKRTLAKKTPKVSTLVDYSNLESDICFNEANKKRYKLTPDDKDKSNEYMFRINDQVYYTNRRGTIVDRFQLSTMKEADYTIEMEDKTIVSVSGSKYLNFIEGNDEKKSAVEYTKTKKVIILDIYNDDNGKTEYLIKFETGETLNVPERDLAKID